jgi:glycosyltransferase involved in cell wall biosynthesis
VFAEAMAMKRPVVALTSGGTPEVVQHGKCGQLSPDDIDTLAANLLRLLDNPALRAQFESMVARGSCRISRRSAWRQILPRFMRACWSDAICFRDPYCAVPAAYRRTERTNK